MNASRQAIQIANSSHFGFFSCVITESGMAFQAAFDFARRLRDGDRVAVEPA